MTKNSLTNESEYKADCDQTCKCKDNFEHLKSITVIPKNEYVLLEITFELSVIQLIAPNKEIMRTIEYNSEIVAIGDKVQNLNVGEYVLLRNNMDVIPVEMKKNERSTKKLVALYEKMSKQEVNSISTQRVQVIDYVLTPCYNIIAVELEPTSYKTEIKTAEFPEVKIDLLNEPENDVELS